MLSGRALRRAVIGVVYWFSCGSISLAAQGHEHMAGMAGMTTPLGISMDRMGSGTTWIPDATPIPSVTGRILGWDLTTHGLVFLQYIRQGGPRGDDQLGSLNWGMVMLSRPLAGGTFQIRSMLSLDPATVTERGYPQLLQTGEQFENQPLHDRQHPHDFWMELGALYLRQVARHAAVELYLAPAGEPALGPVAFMHRPSAVDDPIAPLGHHWQDATHISFGVVTAGLFSHRWKLEGSLFNGREPDDHRWGIDLDKLDSWSGRLSYNSRAHWSATLGFGKLRQEDETMHRLAASVLHGKRLGTEGRWATTLVYGANIHTGNHWTHSLLLESEAVLDGANTVFGRAEWLEKTAADLVIPGDPEAGFRLAGISAGYLRELVHRGGLTLGLGFRGSIGLVGSELEPFYGTRRPLGGMVFLRLRPR